MNDRDVIKEMERIVKLADGGVNPYTLTRKLEQFLYIRHVAKGLGSKPSIVELYQLGDFLMGQHCEIFHESILCQ